MGDWREKPGAASDPESAAGTRLTRPRPGQFHLLLPGSFPGQSLRPPLGSGWSTSSFLAFKPSRSVPPPLRSTLASPQMSLRLCGPVRTPNTPRSSCCWPTFTQAPCPLCLGRSHPLKPRPPRQSPRRRLPAPSNHRLPLPPVSTSF